MLGDVRFARVSAALPGVGGARRSYLARMNPSTADPNAGLARIVVAAPMKSGSTFVAASLSTYFGVENPPVDYDWGMEHALTQTFLAQVRGRSFSMNLHMLPHYINAEGCRTENIRLVVLWRNIGDMLVSIDEHQYREPGLGPGMFIMKDEHYRALDLDARMRFLIDTVAQWYIAFYLRWRRVGAPMYAYERMLVDERGFFTDIMRDALGHEPMVDRLDAALAVTAGPERRLNVGRAGRSAEKMSDDNKRRLEERLLTHPDVADLEILLWELPWDVPALAARTPLDGHVVRTAGDESPLFVSRGIAYPVTPQWLASRPGDRRAARIVEDAALAALPRGELLT
jgi:hypothetical protein